MNVYVENENDIIHETDTDFVLRPVFREIHLVQYDKTLPVIKVNLFSNGQRYILPNNAEVNVRFCQLDGTEIYKPVLGCNVERNAVYFDADEEITSLKGRFQPVLELYFGANKHGCSSPILVTIDRNPITNKNIV